MRQRHNLRHEMAVVTSQAQALVKALFALPDTAEAMQEAKDDVSATERQQMAETLAILAHMGNQIHQRSRWLRQQMQEGITR